MEEFQIYSEGETKEEPKIVVEHKKKFEAIYEDNNKYDVSICKKGKYLFTETEIIKDCLNKKYSNIYDINTLKKNNKFLILYDTIDDIIDSIYENGTNFSCKLITNHNNLELRIPVPVKNVDEISLILKERKLNMEEIIKDLTLKTNSYLKEMKEQKIKIEEQLKKINDVEKRVQILEIENKNLKNELKVILKNEILAELKDEKLSSQEKKIKKETPKEIKIETKKDTKKETPKEIKIETKKENIEINPIINSESQIINSEQFKQLNNWINPIKSLNFELIYTASINGDDDKNFHKNCDGKGPTVTIVKSKNGYIFGGYLTVPFSYDRQSHYDDKAFLFSLTNMKKFPIKLKEHAVFHYNKGWGPYIGYKDKCDLAIKSECLSNKKSYCEPTSYEFERVDLIGSYEKNFEVEDYEIYLIN